MSDSPADLLLVEDNPGDVRLTREALTGVDVACTLHVVDNGEEALEFCRQRGEYADGPAPDVILLDMSLPRWGGGELLAELRADAETRAVPVIVFSGSDSRADVRAAYDNRANAYLTKPTDPDEFVETVRTFARFWLSTARLPRDV